MEEENQQDNTIKFYSIKERMLSCPYYPRKIECLREKRNGTFTLYFDWIYFSVYVIYNVCVNWQREM